MNLQFDIIEILKVTMVLFAVIDVIGSIPIIINLKQKTGGINARKASFVSFFHFNTSFTLVRVD